MTVQTYFMAGEQLNVLETALSVASTSADALFPLANLYIGRPSRPFRFDENGADLVMTAEIDRVTNGGFEIGTLDNWTEALDGTGSTSKDVGTVHSGSASLEADGGAAGLANRFQDINVRAGERMQADVWLYGGGGVTANAAVQNRKTGLFLSDAGVWGAGLDPFATQAAAAWAQTQLAFQVESLSDCGGQSLVTLRIHLYNDDNGSAYFDDVKLYPAVNFVSIHGHNLAPVVVPELRSSSDAFVGVDDLEATLTIKRPSFYAYMGTPVYASGWRLELAGTNDAVPYLGEMVLGYAETIAKAQRWDYSLKLQIPEVRNQTGAMEVHTSRLSDDAPRVLRLRFKQMAISEMEEMRDAIWRRSYGGDLPMVIVPYAADGDVLHGRIMSPLDVRRKFLTVSEDELVVQESGFPVVGL